MTILLYAKPYDMSVEGFYFKTIDQYNKQADGLTNSFNQPVDEFSIQFVDGGLLDCELAEAIGLNQGNLEAYFEAVDNFSDYEKHKTIIACGDLGECFCEGTQADDFEIDIYYVDSLKDLAEQFVDEGLFGDIPDHLEFYIDYAAIARDLSVDYSEIIINGQRLVYRSY